MKRSLIVILVLVFSIVRAQQPATSTWIALRLPLNINAKWQLINDAGYRTIGYSASAYQYLYRTGVRYFVSPEWSAASGIAFFYTRTSSQKTNHEFGKEFRLWQELNYQYDFKKGFTLQNRLRTEERFFAAVKTQDKYNTFRLRYRVSGTQKISGKWSLMLGDEYMEQEKSKHFSFNQNRVMLSAMYDANSTTQLQGGYIWALLPSSSEHIVTLSLQKNLSFHAHEKHS